MPPLCMRRGKLVAPAWKAHSHSRAIKRLFDPESFRGYGPHSYDLHQLIARDRARRMRKQKAASLKSS